MSGRNESTDTRRAHSMADTFGRLQVSPHQGLIILDVQGRHYSTGAQLYVDHGFARLSVPQAIRLRGMLDQAIEAALDAPIASLQPDLWSPATTAAVASRMGRAA
jgi:hypothetical protein